LSTLVIDNACFVCGKENHVGLKLEIHCQDVFQENQTLKKAVCSFSLSKEFQGYGGVIHGGILSTILDELMIYSLYYEEIPSVTAKIEVTFKKRVSPGELLFGEAWLAKNRGKMAEACGILRNQKKEIVAKARGLFAKVVKVEKNDDGKNK